MTDPGGYHLIRFCRPPSTAAAAAKEKKSDDFIYKDTHTHARIGNHRALEYTGVVITWDGQNVTLTSLLMSTPPSPDLFVSFAGPNRNRVGILVLSSLHPDREEQTTR